MAPFKGSLEDRREVLGRLVALNLGDRDSVVLVDNGPDPRPPTSSVVYAPEIHSSYYARNRGAERGGADWILFIDADVFPPSDLLDRYFAATVAEDVGLLAGAVEDEQPVPGERLSPASRYTAAKASMGQHNTMGNSETGYAQTANCAIRRSAFEQIGGFRSDIRSGGDADLCFRLRSSAWRLESRPEAAVTHRNRTTLRALARQRARHGSGAAWLNQEHPGSFPPARSLGKVKWSGQELRGALRGAVRGDRDDVVLACIDVVSHWAFEFGRFLPNHSHSAGPAQAARFTSHHERVT